MQEYNHVRRFIDTVHFRPVDRIPLWEFGYLNTTVLRWEKEGLPPNSDLKEFFGLDSTRYFPQNCFFNILGPVPAFEEKTLEDTDSYRIYIDSEGIMKKQFKGAGDVSMPHFIKYPISSREDWNFFREKLDPYCPERYPTDWENIKARWSEHDNPLTIFVGSFYGLLRNWIGVENFSIMFYEEPALVEEMIDYLTDFFINATTRALEEVRFDHAHLWEDMAYKTGSLLAPQMVRKFMLPGYKKIMEHLRGYGIDVFSVDCDGNIDELIPIWLEAGINGMLPCEVAAGMDVVKMRKKYGRDIWIVGGIDKRALAQGRRAIDDEIYAKVPFMLENGGYIPSIDHEVPHDISLSNYRYYLEQLKKCVMKG
ncbi:MAG: uroporphyrinogen decarboxylase family protein [Victivallales bacterium]